MSPPSSRAQARRKRSLVLSVMLVVIVAFGSLFATLAAGWKPLLGLDLAGGFSVVYKPVTHASASELSETVTILNNRVNALGVSGGTVTTQGDQIVVSVPGVKNPTAVLKTIGQTDQLYFRPTLCYAPPYEPPKASSGTTTTTLPQKVPTSCATPKVQLVTTNLSGSPTEGTGVSYNVGATDKLVGLQEHQADIRQPQDNGAAPGAQGHNIGAVPAGAGHTHRAHRQERLGGRDNPGPVGGRHEPDRPGPGPVEHHGQEVLP